MENKGAQPREPILGVEPATGPPQCMRVGRSAPCQKKPARMHVRMCSVLWKYRGCYRSVCVFWQFFDGWQQCASF